jgi:glutathione peroxidase
MADLDRRAVLLGVAAVTIAAAAPAEQTAWDFTFDAIEDGPLPLVQFRGRVLLVTNTASFCGYTYQYKALEALNADWTAKGLTVVGVPSQDFNQESDSNGKVKTFCEATFGVQFPMAGLTHVRGPAAHPFYRWVRAQKDWEPSWNFNKVLIGRDGRIAGLFPATEEPDGPNLRRALTVALEATV